MPNSWIPISLINFLIAAIMGVILRAAFVWELNWMDYKNMLHGHSHIAMLGWVNLILLYFIIEKFIPETKRIKKTYTYLFWATQITVLGMMVSFPIQGYGNISIPFSSIYILISYLFIWNIWKDIDTNDKQSETLVRSALIFLLLSSLGLWFLGAMMALKFNSVTLILVSVQFFIHFQLNGWFVLATIALLINDLNIKGVQISKKNFYVFFTSYIIASLLTFSHVLEWAYQYELYYFINSIGVIFQLLSIIFLLVGFYSKWKALSKKIKYLAKVFFFFGIVSWLTKILFQTALIFPNIAEASTQVRNFMIGYIHLSMLGFISCSIFYLLSNYHSLPIIRQSFTLLFIIGYIGTEAILFIQGAIFWLGGSMIPYYHEILFAISVFIPGSIVLMLFQPSLQKNKTRLKQIINKI